MKLLKTNLKLYPEGDVIRVGLNPSAKKRLGKIILVELPEVGEQLSLGFIFGIVLAVNHSIELRMPVDGEIVAINHLLEENPELIKENFVDKNWIIKIMGKARKAKRRVSRHKEDLLRN